MRGWKRIDVFEWDLKGESWTLFAMLLGAAIVYANRSGLGAFAKSRMGVRE
jgi:hypothetical protein